MLKSFAGELLTKDLIGNGPGELIVQRQLCRLSNFGVARRFARDPLLGPRSVDIVACLNSLERLCARFFDRLRARQTGAEIGRARKLCRLSLRVRA